MSRRYLTASEIDADPTVLRQGKAEREKRRNRSGQRAGVSKMRFEGPFAGRTIAMLDSAAYRVLSLPAHRILARLEIELHRHGGKPEENGELPCTFKNFADYGISRNKIAPAIRELVALGFIQVTRQGSAGNADHRQAQLYLLTYYWAGSDVRLVDGWKRIPTIEEAKALAKDACNRKTDNNGARALGIKGARSRWKNKSPVMASIPLSIVSGGGAQNDVVAKLVWSKPGVRELFGEEAKIRRRDIAKASREARKRSLSLIAIANGGESVDFGARPDRHTEV